MARETDKPDPHLHRAKFANHLHREVGHCESPRVDLMILAWQKMFAETEAQVLAACGDTCKAMDALSLFGEQFAVAAGQLIAVMPRATT
jgi:hypothetical protein